MDTAVRDLTVYPSVHLLTKSASDIISWDQTLPANVTAATSATLDLGFLVDGDHPYYGESGGFYDATVPLSRPREPHFVGLLPLYRYPLLPMLFFAAVALAALSNCDAKPLRLSHASGDVQLPDYIAKNLGPYSPYIPVGTYPAPPAHCVVNQVNILQRHGARFPTAGAGKKIIASVAKVKAARSFSKSFAFVPSYNYTLGADDLTPFGAQESHDAGVLTAKRYSMLPLGSMPFVRSDSSQRVVDSAANWSAGFAMQSHSPRRSVLVLNGATGSNDTLENNNCPNAPEPTIPETAWLNLFATNITSRLNAGAPGANLTNADTLNLMQLCGFDSGSSGSLSPWCGIFQTKEWAAFEYYYDLDKFYGNGYGNTLGAIQGVGYVNELLSRVTGDLKFATNDKTQVNHTLDSSPSTFPLARTLYADFSHDNQITSILAAMGLKKGPNLPSTGPPVNQAWVTSQIVPFAGRLVTERLLCGGKQYVRFLINDQLQPATFCGGDKSAPGVCRLEDFVKSQAYSTNNGNGDYSKCGYVPL
ncbi:hypothetical protein P7C70_g3091, partial [Phenoliferia sp. Uapishka_3]